MFKKPFVFLLLIIAVIACRHEVLEPIPDSASANPVVACSDDSVYFRQQLAPLFTSTCAYAGCHDNGPNAPLGVHLTSYENIISSNVVVAGDTAMSKMYKRITNSNPADRMPKGKPPLSAEQIALITKWILQGVQNNSCEELCDTSIIPTFGATVFPIIKNKCTNCHSGTNPGSGITLTNHSEIQSIALDGRLKAVINHLPGYKAMPLGGEKLPSCEIIQIEKWINSGALNN